jgi:DNA-binding transcriptional ArsR family regulator
MSVLQRAGLVRSTRIGQWTYYRRDDERISALPGLIGTSL